MTNIGRKLSDARREKGLSIEDVAHQLRIHPNFVINIEADDFSKFASVAYAKSNLRHYAEFVGVDIGTEMQALNSGVTIRLEEIDFVGDPSRAARPNLFKRLLRQYRRRRPKSKKPTKEKRAPRAPFLLNTVLAALMAALLVFYFLGYDATSLDEARIEIVRGLKNANPFTRGENDSLGERLVGEAPVIRAVPIGEELPMETGETLPGDGRDAGPGRTEETVGSTSAASGLTSEEIAAGTILPPPPPTAMKPMAPRPPAPRQKIEKPEVTWNIGENVPAPMGAVSPGQESNVGLRETPDLRISRELKLPSISNELPDQEESPEEPNAVLRPEGTTPGREALSGGGASESESPENETPPVRAVPVATTAE